MNSLVHVSCSDGKSRKIISLAEHRGMGNAVHFSSLGKHNLPEVG